MTSEFKSVKNKGMLWDLMSNECPDFKKKIRSNFNEIQKNFEDCIIRTHELNSSSQNLLMLNKIFIENMNNILTESKTTPILAKDIQTSRVEKLNNEFDNKKKELDSYMKKEVPNEIDFSLGNDDPIINVDDILNKKIAERKYDISSVMNDNKGDVNEAKKWIGLNENEKSKESQNEIIQSNPTEIFNSSYNNNMDIFDKLKPSSNASFMEDNTDDLNPRTDTHHLLTMILANQKKIMTHLNIV